MSDTYEVPAGMLPAEDRALLARGFGLVAALAFTGTAPLGSVFDLADYFAGYVTGDLPADHRAALRREAPADPAPPATGP